MTVLLDAYAFIAYLRGEAAARRVSSLLWTSPVAMTALQMAEVVDRLERVHGVPADEVEVAASAIGIDIVPVDYPVGVEAGRIRSRHYVPTGRTLSMADSVCAATAVIHGLVVATADPVLLAVARAEGCSVEALPPAGQGA